MLLYHYLICQYRLFTSPSLFFCHAAYNLCTLRGIRLSRMPFFICVIDVAMHSHGRKPILGFRDTKYPSTPPSAHLLLTTQSRMTSVPYLPSVIGSRLQTNARGELRSRNSRKRSPSHSHVKIYGELTQRTSITIFAF